VKVAAVAAVLVVALWAWRHHEHTVLQNKLSAVASELAGRPVHVDCQGFFSEFLDINNRTGEVGFSPDGRPADSTFLTRSICGALSKFMSASTHAKLDCLVGVDWTRLPVEDAFESPCAEGAQSAAEAISTLTHESMHLRGWQGEAQAQCYAIQEIPWTVVRLGGTPQEGAGVASFILARQPGMPSDYQSSECRAGGSLDLHPETGDFPAEPVPQLMPPGFVGPGLAAR
jgi:hypothetical protein